MPRSGLGARGVYLGQQKYYAPNDARKRMRPQCRRHQNEKMPCNRFASSSYCLKKVDKNAVSWSSGSIEASPQKSRQACAAAVLLSSFKSLCTFVIRECHLRSTRTDCFSPLRPLFCCCCTYCPGAHVLVGRHAGMPECVGEEQSSAHCPRSRHQ